MRRCNFTSLFGNGLYYPKIDTGILLVGMPGSGKSTLSYKLTQNHGFLHIGDDVVSFNHNGQKISWGSNHNGPDQLDLRPLPVSTEGIIEDNYETVQILPIQRVYEAKLDLAIMLRKQIYPHIPSQPGYYAYETLEFLKTQDIPIEEVRVTESDIEKTISDVLAIIEKENKCR
ncbi:MAG: AAA family ATPase [Candidatus Woesearchaeota archaeon]